MKILNFKSPKPRKGSGKIRVTMTAAIMLKVNNKPFIAGFC
jgi:hypothetical protein